MLAKLPCFYWIDERFCRQSCQEAHKIVVCSDESAVGMSHHSSNLGDCPCPEIQTDNYHNAGQGVETKTGGARLAIGG